MQRKENTELPVICTMTFEANHRTFTGTEIRSMALTLEGLGADAIGVNCSLGPAEFEPLIKELSRWTCLPIVSKANAGLPDPATGAYQIEAEEFAELTANLIPYGVKLAGGCAALRRSLSELCERPLRTKKYCPQNPDIPAAVCTPEKTVVIDRPTVIGGKNQSDRKEKS